MRGGNELPTASKTEYKYIGHYAHTLDSGQPVEPGQVVKLTKEELADNQGLVEEGQLVELDTGKEG